ncbi:MAG: helix-turn-helix transcriptional regulator [Dehalobacter sp. 4CP]|nr:helix-turn-helix transcriptional regulator [Dehalobacter sp. 4CP]
MENQEDRYHDTMPTILRELMGKHPATGEKTTQRALAKYLNITPQSVSLYMSGKTQPLADILVGISEFFGVSIDYLMKGVSSDNTELHKQLGLSEQAVNMIRIAQKQKSLNGNTDVLPLLNNLLADRDIYVFLEDLVFKAETIRNLRTMPYDERDKKYPGINMEGYSIWDLNTLIQEFIHGQLKKYGLSIGVI